MYRIDITVLFLAVLLLAACGARASEETQASATAQNTHPPIDILYGAYQIVGKESGTNGKSYQAWVRIAVEGEALIMDRCYQGKHTQGRGEIVSITADQLPAVRFNFIHKQIPIEATCTYHSDFDNLPRFSCYTYPDDGSSGAKSPQVPGLEAYFPIIWPVELDFFDCQ